MQILKEPKVGCCQNIQKFRDKTSISASPKFIKELISVKTIQDCGNNPALPYAVGKQEHMGENVVPFNIGVLLHVYEHEEPHED